MSNKRIKFDQSYEDSLAEAAKHDEEEDTGSSDDDNSSSEAVDEKLPVLRSIVDKGRVAENSFSNTEDDIDREAIRQELSTLSFEELQKLKEKIGSKKFQKTLNGSKPIKEEKNYKRANHNRPREMSSKARVVETKPVFQIPKTFRNDPRFDNMCGDFNDQKFHRNYEFISKMKEEELKKLKEELKEETNPKQIDRIKYLIQRTENQLREEKKRKEQQEEQMVEKQKVVESLKQGKTPYFVSKGAKREQDLKEKFENLKKEGRLDKYMAKKRKHNSQRDRKYLPGQ